MFIKGVKGGWGHTGQAACLNPGWAGKVCFYPARNFHFCFGIFSYMKSFHWKKDDVFLACVWIVLFDLYKTKTNFQTITLEERYTLHHVCLNSVASSIVDHQLVALHKKHATTCRCYRVTGMSSSLDAAQAAEDKLINSGIKKTQHTDSHVCGSRIWARTAQKPWLTGR